MEIIVFLVFVAGVMGAFIPARGFWDATYRTAVLWFVFIILINSWVSA